MAIQVKGADSLTVVQSARRSYTVPLILMVSLYFGIGFITSLNNSLRRYRVKCPFRTDH